MPEDEIQKYIRDQVVMAKEINHINKNLQEIKDYIKEDREWKDSFYKTIDSNYARRTEVNELRANLNAVIATLLLIGISIIGYLLSQYI